MNFEEITLFINFPEYETFYGDNDHPIVSISLGSTCSFGYKPIFQKEKFVKLESGDILIWGGPERMLEHCVDKVFLF